MEEVKSCQTCARREGKGEYARCNYSGYFCTTERMHPTKCGRDYQWGWVSMNPQPTLWEKIKFKLKEFFND